MTPEDESLIEQYLRAPDALSDDRRRTANTLLANDPAAAAYATFLQAFYDHLDAEDQRGPDARVRRFVDDLFASEEEAPEPVVRMRPFRPRRDAESTVLAAATERVDDDRRFTVLATLAAEAQNVLVRIVEDRKTGRGRLYVLSEAPDAQPPAVVSFPSLGLDFATDADGTLTFDLPDGISPDDWAEASALVRFPVAECRLPPDAETTLHGPDDAAVHCTRTDGTLSVQLPSDAGPAALLSVETPDGTCRVLPLSPDSPSSLDATDDPLLLRLYV